jgi:SAM-dependent methyltransferase
MIYKIINKASNILQDYFYFGKILDDIIRKKYVRNDTYTLHPPHSTSYFVLKKLIRSLNFQDYENFYDIGCGYGRVLLFLQRYLKTNLFGIKLIGVELVPEIANVAIKNVSNSKINIFCSDAMNYHFDPQSIIFLNNPFDRETLINFYSKINQINGSFTIVYWGNNNDSNFEVFKDSVSSELIEIRKFGKIYKMIIVNILPNLNHKNKHNKSSF